VDAATAGDVAGADAAAAAGEPAVEGAAEVIGAVPGALCCPEGPDRAVHAVTAASRPATATTDVTARAAGPRRETVIAGSLGRARTDCRRCAGRTPGLRVGQDGAMQPAELVASFRPHLDGALIATDFDGTLAPLQHDPEKSRPADGAIEALSALARCGAQVAVITGRDAQTVVRLGKLAAVPGIVVAGLYGAETWTDGELVSPETPAAIEALRERLPDALTGADPALWIEDKRLSLVVHARRAADPAAALAAVREPVARLADELGLELHPGSGVLELRLPGFDKAGALATLARGRAAALFLGDDLGDLPAYAEIARLRSRGVAAWGVGVLSSGAEGIDVAADVTVDDADAAVALLRELAG
jgi:trehalose 6-phosphate phosphatase